jgi:hypothetical protein
MGSAGGFEMVVGDHTPIGYRPRGLVGQVVVKAGQPLLAAAVGIAGLMWLLGSLLIHGSIPTVVSQADTHRVAQGHGRQRDQEPPTSAPY